MNVSRLIEYVYILLKIGSDNVLISAGYDEMYLVSIGTSNTLKFAFYINQKYNRKEIYRKCIHVKDMPCQVSGMTSGCYRLGK